MKKRFFCALVLFAFVPMGLLYTFLQRHAGRRSSKALPVGSLFGEGVRLLRQYSRSNANTFRGDAIYPGPSTEPIPTPLPLSKNCLGKIRQPQYHYKTAPAAMWTVSVIVACHEGHFWLLHALLRNIAQQSVASAPAGARTLEVIIGASTCSHKNARQMEEGARLLELPFSVKVVEITTRANAGTNRNRAAQAASGSHILVSDMDDLLHVDRMQVSLNFFQQNPDMNLLIGSYVESPTVKEWGGGGKPFDESEELIPPDLITCDPKSTNLMTVPKEVAIHHGHIMFKREVWERVQYQEGNDFNRGQDGKFCQEVQVAMGGVFYTHHKMIAYNPDMILPGLVKASPPVMLVRGQANEVYAATGSLKVTPPASALKISGELQRIALRRLRRVRKMTA